MFTKNGQRIQNLKREILFRGVSESTSTHFDTIPNGGAAAIANLETTQKIIANPNLLEQFKKDTELTKTATARAVAWLKDLRSEQEVQAASSQVWHSDWS